ncbi:hypothetical protein CANARDRAFT_25932 [[Candida] arabinofermentans NRRL YB-2248]|uniref:F-box domain-containing protein n=1 Tax=[Candida] arabinofermentans NRRL YB-2248 TaxID=983967 RepID=A0A1E4T7G2_9ASCO|nr:hypothetical protein CANARDRAFT_25932 [[Candida] arabinofermentans NRRL YB-2248]
MDDTLTDMDKTLTVFDLMAKLPLKVQHTVLSFIKWDEYPVELLLQLILYGPSVWKSTLAEKLFEFVTLNFESTKLGMNFEIDHESDNFDLLLQVLEHLGSDTEIQGDKVIGTLNILELDDDDRFETIFDNTKNLEIDGVELVDSLRWFNDDYLKKIKRCRLYDLESINLRDLKLVLNGNLEVLDIYYEHYVDEDLESIKFLFNEFNLLDFEQKNIKINLNVGSESIGGVGFSLFPSLRVPNLEITLNIMSTKYLKAGQLKRYICKSFDSKNITHLCINFDKRTTNENLKDASFIETLIDLKVLKLKGMFSLGSNSRSPRLNLDELELSGGYVNLSNVIAKKVTLSFCEMYGNTINEGVEELIETSSLDWDKVNLPSTLIRLNIESEASFENNFDIFKNLNNLKELRLVMITDTTKLILPPNLQYFDYKISDYLIDFDLPRSLRTLAAYSSELAYLRIDQIPINLKTLIAFVEADETDLKMRLPTGLKYLTLKKLQMDSDTEENCENLTVLLCNIESLVEIKVVGDFSGSVSFTTSDDEKKHLDKINIIYDKTECEI